VLHLFRIAVIMVSLAWPVVASPVVAINSNAMHLPIKVLALGLDIVKTISSFALALAPGGFFLSSTHGEKVGRGYWRQK
jgi:hypothetical protein